MKKLTKYIGGLVLAALLVVGFCNVSIYWQDICNFFYSNSEIKQDNASHVAALGSQIDDLEGSVDSLKKNVETLQTENGQIKSQLEASDSENEELKAKLKQNEESIAQMESQIESLQETIKTLRATVASMTDENGQLKEENSTQKDTIQSLNDTLKQLREQVQALNDRIEQLEDELKQYTTLTFEMASWEQIAKISEQISSQNMNSQQVEEKYGWEIGDEKTFRMTTGEEVTMQILGFNHDDKSDGSGKAGITLGMKNLLTDLYLVASNGSNVGGWDKCELRTNTMPTLFSQLPFDLQAVIKPVNKNATIGGGSDKSPATTIVTSSDKLWVCAVAEIVPSTFSDKAYLGDLGEGSQYEYYSNLFGGSYKTSAMIKRLSNGTGKELPWMLRSPTLTEDWSFQGVDAEGYICNFIFFAGVEAKCGISFCFCI